MDESKELTIEARIENVDKVIEFLLADDGQEIIRKTGYGGLEQN